MVDPEVLIVPVIEIKHLKKLNNYKMIKLKNL